MGPELGATKIKCVAASVVVIDGTNMTRGGDLRICFHWRRRGVNTKIVSEEVMLFCG